MPKRASEHSIRQSFHAAGRTQKAHRGFLVCKNAYRHHTRPLVHRRLERQRVGNAQTMHIQNMLAVIGNQWLTIFQPQSEARQAALEGEVPVGAVVVCNNKIIARAHNQTERLNDPTAHAEMLALTAATGVLGAKYLPECTLYVTVEPCGLMLYIGGKGSANRRYLLICHAKIAIFSELRAMVAQIYTSIHILPVYYRVLSCLFQAIWQRPSGSRQPASKHAESALFIFLVVA